MESFILELNQSFFRTMHSSALRARMHCLEGRDATSDHETSDAEIGDAETGDEGASESKMAFLRGLDTVYLLNIEH